MTPIEILKGARELLSDPAKWTKGKAARDQHGIPVLSSSFTATCFCMVGAIERVGCEDISHVNPYPRTYEASRELRRTVIGRTGLGTAEFNDRPETTHAEVLGMFDAAISRLERVAA